MGFRRALGRWRREQAVPRLFHSAANGRGEASQRYAYAKILQAAAGGQQTARQAERNRVPLSGQDKESSQFQGGTLRLQWPGKKARH